MIRFTAGILLVLMPSAMILANGLPDGPYLSTSAAAVEEVDPDYAVLKLNFRTEQPTPELARNRTNDAQQELIAILKEFEDALRDQEVESLTFGESFEYNRAQERRVRTGFYGRFSVRLEVGDFEALKKLHYQLSSLEWNELDNPRFAVEDHERVERIVRDRALAKAGEQAQALVAKQGVNLGPVWGIIYEPLHDLAGRSPGVVSEAHLRAPILSMSIATEEFALPVEPRPIVFEARVGVVYELIPNAQPND